MKNVAFITGATGGLGKAFAVECAGRGWDLYLTDLHQDRLALLAGSLHNTYGVGIDYLACDLTDPDGRAGLFATLRQKAVDFTFLINVAGLDYEGPFLDRSRDELRSIIRLNVEATLEVTHAILEIANPAVPLHVIIVSSLAAFYPMPVKATYAASKRFLLDFSLALRDEIRSRGATVTALCPAGLPTTQSSLRSIQSQGLMGQLTTQDIGAVAAQAIEAALRDRPVVIPGALNRLLQIAGSLVPPRSLAAFIGRRWRLTRKRLQAAGLES
jgi:short-subunit dehydrogenase